MITVHTKTFKKLANTIIDEVKRNVSATVLPPVNRETYAQKTAGGGGKITEEQFTLLVNTKDTITTYEQIKNKISLPKNNIKLSRDPHLVSKKNLITNFPTERDLNGMKTGIEKLGIRPETTVRRRTKLNPTIKIFNVGDTEDLALEEFIVDITGDKPTYLLGG